MTYVTTSEKAHQFWLEHKKEIAILESFFLEPHNEAAKETDIQARISWLDIAIFNYYMAEKWFIAHGEYGGLYLIERWYHIPNSEYPDRKWIDFMMEERQNLVDELEVEKYIMKHAEEGLLQKNIAKEFPDMQKYVIRNIIRDLEAAGRIRKEKKGNTNLITLP